MPPFPDRNGLPLSKISSLGDSIVFGLSVEKGFLKGGDSVSVLDICNKYMVNHLNTYGLPYMSQRFLYKNVASEANFGIYNQMLLQAYTIENNLTNNLFFISWNQLKEFNSRVESNTSGALTTYYKDRTINSRTFGQLAYYFTFPLCRTSLLNDYSAVQEDHFTKDARESAQELVQKGYENIQADNSVSIDQPSIDNYYQQSLINLAIASNPTTENNLVLELTSAYLLNSCGYRLQKSKEDPKEVANIICNKPKYLLDCASIAQKKINNIFN